MRRIARADFRSGRRWCLAFAPLVQSRRLLRSPPALEKSSTKENETPWPPAPRRRGYLSNNQVQNCKLGNRPTGAAAEGRAHRCPVPRCLLPPCTRSSLQRLVGDFVGEDRFSHVESDGGVVHGIGPFVRQRHQRRRQSADKKAGDKLAQPPTSLDIKSSAAQIVKSM